MKLWFKILWLSSKGVVPPPTYIRVIFLPEQILPYSLPLGIVNRRICEVCLISFTAKLASNSWQDEFRTLQNDRS